MAARDLTRKFEALRNSSRAKMVRTPLPDHSKDNQVLLDVNETANGPAVTPEWVDIVANVKSDLKTIKDNLVVLSRLHAKRLQVSFGDNATQDQEKEIEIVTEQITAMMRKAENSVKLVAGGGNGLRLTSQERTSRLNVMRALGAELSETSKKFRNAQKAFLSQLKKQDSVGDKYGFIPDEALASSSGSAAVDEDINDQQRAQMDALERNSDQRLKSIIHIAQSVNELATLFKELNVLVVEQGSVLDRIDYNIEQTVVKVQSGRKHLVEADKTSKKAYTFKLLLVLLVIDVILLIVLIAKNSSSSN